LLHGLNPLEGSGAIVRQGLATADDFRYVRAFWEVAPTRIARTREETARRRWVPFAKGGEYSPYYGDLHLLIDWERDGERIREDPKAVVRSPQQYSEAGLTWPERTVSAFASQVLPAGAVFSVVGPLCRPLGSVNAFALMGWLNSRLIR